MGENRTIRILHHLARTGGTVISKCLAVMDGVALLSEVHPLGMAEFNPLVQARDWYQLVTADEAGANAMISPSDFTKAIALILRRCEMQRRRLVLRDWSHLDFTGVPFVRNPSYRLLTAEVLGGRFQVLHTATVRHPLDQLISLRRLNNMQQDWDEARSLYGFRRFAERAVEIGFLRYEDFTADPDNVLRRLCERLDLAFDAGYKDRWAGYRNITGAVDSKRHTIEPESRRSVEPGLLTRLYENGDYRATLEMLGYEHPRHVQEDCLRPPAGPHPERKTRNDSHARATNDNILTDDKGIDFVFERGNQLTKDKQWDAAIDCYQRVLTVRPRDEWALNNLGYCLSQTGRFDWAVLELRRSLGVNGHNILALENLVYALEQSGGKFDAIAYLRRLTELEPENARRAFALGYRLGEAGCIAEALFYLRRTLELKPDHQAAISDYLLFLNYCDQQAVEAVAREHFRLAQRWIQRPRRQDGDFRQTREPDRRLKLGYVSSDLFTHPVGKAMASVLGSHDRQVFEVYCYYSGKQCDRYTDQIRDTAGVFRRMHEQDDEAVEQQILEDGIDVLVDLGGSMAGGNRLSVFASRTAPVQVSFLGYPQTTGLDAMDYFITDAYCNPPGKTEHLHSEELVRLARGFVCFAPPAALPTVLPTPFRMKGHLTFGSFNNPSKLSDAAMAAWAEILSRVADSRLVFKYGDRFTSEWLCERYRSRFAAKNIDPARLEFLPMSPTAAGHLEAIGQADICLDPWPYQGMHTTLESLAMGVPVITLCGETYVRRASSALMMRLGLEDLVAETPEEYVNLAVELANDTPLLEELRSGLRPKFLESEVCDVAGFVRELETAFRRMWRTWCGRESASA